MEIIGIKTNDGYYITDNISAKDYFNTSLSDKVINGEKPMPTYNKNWVKVTNEPTVIEKYVSQPPINKRWELKDASFADKLPMVYKEEDVLLTRVDYENIYAEEFTKVRSLYEFKQDDQPNILEKVEFTYRTVTEIEEIKTPTSFSYKRAGQWTHQGYPNVTNKDVKHDMISMITTPELLLHETSCKLTSKETYDIIRAYVKDNINPKVAVITSDYDFCFTVKKKITLAKEHVYQVDVNDNFFGLLGKRKKKPKYETRVQKVREVEIFEMTGTGYNNYTLIKPFEGDSQDDLKNNIDNYLSHLMSVINEPLCECNNCGGTGVIFNKP